MARPNKMRCICALPAFTEFLTVGVPPSDNAVVLGYDEYEILRLIDYEHFSQEQCAQRMQISRPSVARMYKNAREKLMDFLVNGKQLCISGGDVVLCTSPRPECYGSPHCCLVKQSDAPASDT